MFVIMRNLLLLLVLNGCTSGIVSEYPKGYHRNEYRHDYSNAPPVRDVK